MESASRSSSLPMPPTHSAASRKRRILDSSDTEEQPNVKRSRSLVPRVLGDNSVPQPSNNLQKPTSNIDNKTVRDKKKRRKRKRKVPVVQDNLEGENAERGASQVASGSGSRRSPSLAPMRELGAAPVTPPSTHPLHDATGTPAPGIHGETAIKRETQSPAILSPEDGQSAPDGESSTSSTTLDTPVSTPVPSDTNNLLPQLNAQKALMSSLLPSLTCQICLFLMHRPFALAPCGHSACHSCLVGWFSSNPGQDGQIPPAAEGDANANAPAQPPPNNDGEPHNENAQQNFAAPFLPKKTCPHCRAVVRERPVEVWAIKDMVLNITKSGLVDAELISPALQQEIATGEQTRDDPWANIFPKVHNHNPFGNVDFANVEEMEMADEEMMGVFDEQDGGIYRCVDCLHEIEDGICSGCQRAYAEYDDIYGWLPGSDSDSDDSQDVGGFAHLYAHLFDGAIESDAESEEEGVMTGEDEDDDDDSFIVHDLSDGDIDPPVPGAYHEDHDPFTVSDGSDDGEDLDDHPNPRPTVVRRSRRLATIMDEESETEAYHSESDLAEERAAIEHEMYGDDGSVPTRLNRYASPVEDEEDGDDEPPIPLYFRTPVFGQHYGDDIDRYSVQGAASDDDDDDELAYDLGAYSDDDAEASGTDYGAYDEY